MTPDIRPGLLVLHGNRLEALRDAVSAWLSRHPLEPLEEEIFLVQSNGAAEWLKMSLASGNGICASSRVELPARFLWRAYRRMLGPGAVPTSSPLEKSALVWRLMRLLPRRLGQSAFAPIARFLHDGNDLERRLQLAERVADLYDQYQVYRADWLEAWARGRDVLRTPSGADRDLPADQRWQAALWRDLLAELSDAERHATRAQVHRDFVAALAAGAAPHSPLPRRVVLFGTSHVPGQTLEALAALSRHAQVLLAIPNPCRYHWADIIEGRELLRPPGRRHALRGGRDLAAVPLETMHVHAHPLLAAWGRQGRDFMRQLDAFDDVERARNQFDVPRVDLFDEGEGSNLLEQVQAMVRDLVPLAEHPRDVAPSADRSIVFHVAHNPQREVEVLHDQLLGLLADTRSGRPLRPREIVVMVPDIDAFAPAIRAVFGQHAQGDARRIPYGIVDIRNRGHDPLVIALEWLLRAPAQRFRLSEVKDLLEVPAIARRFGLEEVDLPRLAGWIEGAGVRWGLDEAQRAGLGLEACGEQNTWGFGLRRMLLGYASGAAFAGVEPYDEIGGLEASLVGALADLVDRLGAWCRECRREATAREWARRGRVLLAALVEPADEGERLTLAALESGLAEWLGACELAGFDEPVPLAVFREAWLGAVDPPGGARRFLAGGVTFCTLMPLRAVPFEVVCLLGMNDGAYPRQSRRSDFDLMGLPGQQRPGDRSRRDDDRYLMLEALLSARRALYVSWSGRNPRDNSEQPPSVLVSQLRDYLRAGWRGEGDGDAVAQRTTEHPLQPFSIRYFDGKHLFTYAREWRSAHGQGSKGADETRPVPPFESTGAALAMDRLARFLKNPAKAFFRERLDVVFDEIDAASDDDEAFALEGLDRYLALSDLIADAPDGKGDDEAASLDLRVRQIAGAGRLPVGEAGTRLANELAAIAAPMRAERLRFHARFPDAAPPRRLQFEHDGLAVDDWLDGLQTDGADAAWIAVRPSAFADKDGAQPRADKLVDAWVRMLVSSACGRAAVGFVVGRDVTLRLRAPDRDRAEAALRNLLDVWRRGMDEPLPLPLRSAIAWVRDGKAQEVYEGSFDREGERSEPCLARTFPDFSTLVADGSFETLAQQVYAPMLHWLETAVEVVRREPGAAVSVGDPAHV
jgi:exodeoxyribonuclease V gamma subunit